MRSEYLTAQINRQIIERDYISVYYPHVQGLGNRDVENRINRRILNLVEELINSQLEEDAIVEITGSYLVRLNKKSLLSICFEVYSYREMAAHGLTVVKSLTFDLNSGRVYQLDDFFWPDSGYIQYISNQIKNQIIEEDIPLIADFNSIDEDQDYYLSERFLIIYFQLYEYTPYVYGIPQFHISLEELKPCFRNNSPLYRLTKS